MSVVVDKRLQHIKGVMNPDMDTSITLLIVLDMKYDITSQMVLLKISTLLFIEYLMKIATLPCMESFHVLLLDNLEGGGDK